MIRTSCLTFRRTTLTGTSSSSRSGAKSILVGDYCSLIPMSPTSKMHDSEALTVIRDHVIHPLMALSGCFIDRLSEAATGTVDLQTVSPCIA